MWNEDGDLMFRFFLFFIITLFGAMQGSRKTELKYKTSDIIIFFVFIVIYHLIMLMARYNNIANRLQIICMAPLVLTIYYFYKICNFSFMRKIYSIKIVQGGAIHFLSMLTLEIYLVQGLIISLIGDRLNFIFPLNLILVFIMIAITGYLLKILTKYISITLNNVDIKEIMKI
jgi:hypothetical protein